MNGPGTPHHQDRWLEAGAQGTDYGTSPHEESNPGLLITKQQLCH